ncbi:uncharacterized protein N7511_010945 [Penicillium nucicola]|uniref:uncharacterized protein n=1 Tax=Penicillium nucicola TaxID=1850975 RepID=UPI002544F2FF|nr:uncharacterized protein N7511_010945 [Penicillium nucicola]KAJ5749249.1 hypothetical protein N7511_010945 [Penicillium nucicola]
MNAQLTNVAGAARSDLTQLWEAAVEEYEKETGHSLQLNGFNSMEEIMKGTESMYSKFKAFRNDQSKVSKVRTAFKNNMWLIQNIVDTVQSVASAASAFPPAMPVSLIFTAFGQVMQSFADVSADYDNVMGFLDFTHRFFDRLSILDQKLPNMLPFQRCVTRIFSSILKICSIAQKYATQKRLRKWFSNLVKGSDEELKAASTQLEEAVNEFNQAAGLTTLRSVDVMSEVVQSIEGNTEFLVSNATLIDERTTAILRDQERLADLQQKTLEKVGDQSQALDEVTRYLEKIQITSNYQQAPPEPVSTVPFTRDPNFVDRGTLLDEIVAQVPSLSCKINVSSSGSRIALVGLGGVGKSQLAIELSYRILEQSPQTWVFWVYASNTARFEQSYREIADRVKIPSRDSTDANIFKLVYDWLQWGNKDWVLILDNVDEHEFLSEKRDSNGASEQPLASYIPQCQHGLLIMTSRSRDVALKFVDDSEIVVVDPMDKPQASALMKNKLGFSANEDDILDLTEALDFMPLAIVQAAAYIKKRVPRYSVSRYLEDFQKGYRKGTRLLEHEAGHLQRDREANSSILTTWQISFNHIRACKPSAANLLSLMSFFDRQGITEELVQDVRFKENDSDGDSTSDSDFDDGFDEDIETLRDYSFISISPNGKSFQMHRLVQLSTRRWLETRDEYEHWQDVFFDVLFQKFPSAEYENWELCHLMFPHIKSAMSQFPKSQNSLMNWAFVLLNGALYARKSGTSIDVQSMAAKAVKIFQQIHGPEHYDTLRALQILAIILHDHGQIHESESLEVQVLEIRKRILGANHPDTLTSMGNLATILSNLGRFNEAEVLEVQVLEIRKKMLGADHPGTLTSMSNLASTISDLGRFTEAESLEVQVLESRKKILGADHPDILSSMSNLATILSNLGRFNEAKELKVHVLESRKKILGADHPDTLSSMGNLASTLSNLGRFTEAEALEVHVLERKKKILGANHPNTLISMSNLASTLNDLGRFAEAKALEAHVLESRKKMLGADLPGTRTSISNLAFTLRDLGRIDEAEVLEVHMLESMTKILGADHPDTLTSMGNLASTLSNLDRFTEAEVLEVHVLESRKKMLGADHPSTLTSMSNLASTLKDLDRLQDAEALAMIALESRERVLGTEHPNTLKSGNLLARILRGLGQFHKAEALFVSVLETRRRVLDVQHPATLRSMAELARTWKSLGRHVEALDMLGESLAMRKQVLGPEHYSVLSDSETLLQWETDGHAGQESSNRHDAL